MSGKAPAFQFYASDFLSGTTFLSAAAVGAYIRMLSQSWTSGPIPDSPVAFHKAMGLGPTDPPFDVIWGELRCKWVRNEQGWINEKLEKVRADQVAFRASRGKAGRASGRARRRKKYEHSLNIRSTQVSTKDQQNTNPSVFDLRSSSSVSGLQPSASEKRERLSPLPSPDDLRDEWNVITTDPIPQCRELSAERTRKAKTRLRERPLTEWREVMERIQASAFCRGENDRGWVATFDWLLQADTAVKVLEGKYDNRGSPSRGSRTGDSTEAAKDYLKGKLQSMDAEIEDGYETKTGALPGRR